MLHHIRESCERNRIDEETSCSVAEGQIQVATGSQRIRKKFSRSTGFTRLYGTALEQRGKEDEPKMVKITKKSGSGEGKSQHTGPFAELLNKGGQQGSPQA